MANTCASPTVANKHRRVFQPLLLKDLKHMALKGGLEQENVFVELQEQYTKICDELLQTTSGMRYNEVLDVEQQASLDLLYMSLPAA